MRCTNASELMDQVLDGRATSERQAALLAHVADCVACRSEWSAIQKVDGVLAAAPRVVPPPGFTRQVMARLPRRRPAQKPWAGALALFAGTIVLLFFAFLSVLGVSSSPESTGLFAIGGAGLLQVGSQLVDWLQAGWAIRQTMLSLIPAGLIVLYVMLSLVSLVIWIGLVTGMQGALQPAGFRET